MNLAFLKPHVLDALRMRCEYVGFCFGFFGRMTPYPVGVGG
jgi:hypothetical protein